jgi:starch synthase
MIALRYGVVPLARAAGARADVVIDATTPRRGAGFVFTDYNSGALLAAARRALRAYRRASRWTVLQRRGLQQARHFTWARAARSYLALYQQATAWRKESAIRLTAAPPDNVARLGAP